MSLWNRADGAAYEAVVDIGAEQVTRFEHRPGVQPNFTTDEYHEVDEMLRAHPDVIAALAARGIDDPSLVLFDTWAYGEALVPKRYRGRRVGWTDAWLRTAADTNPYAHMVSGFHCVVDTNSLELLEIDDSGPVPQPPVMGEYAPRHVPDFRRTRRPQAARDHPAAGRIVHPRRPPAGMAALDDADRLHPARRLGAAPSRLRAGRPHPPDRPSHVVRRDGRALPRPHPRPLPPHRLRHR